MKQRYTLFIMWLALCLVADLSAQSHPDRHTTNAFDGWLSCSPSANPNAIHGSSHWIRYDFGQAYALHDITFWNMNHPDYITSGLKNVIIEYSTNGSSWTTLDTTTIPKANASGMYEGVHGPDLQGVNARYLLITAVDNYGGGCYGLSEIRVYTQDQTASEFNLAFSPCESEGVYQRLTGGMELNGTYSGQGVSDNGDETFDFDVQKAGAGTHTIYYNYSGGSLSADITVLPCTDPFCSDCPECVTDDLLAVNMNPIPGDIYQGYEITSTGRVPSSNLVEFMANEAVELLPGFEVSTSGEFVADFRYCAENKTTNAGFENGTTDWNLYVDTGGGAAATASAVSSNPYEEAHSGRVAVTNATADHWRVQFMQEGHSFEAGKEYELSFYGRADNGSTISLRIELNVSPWTSHMSATPVLTQNWKKYAYRFTPDITITGGVRISAQCGAAVDNYYFDKVRYVEVP